MTKGLQACVLFVVWVNLQSLVAFAPLRDRPIKSTYQSLLSTSRLNDVSDGESLLFVKSGANLFWMAANAAPNPAWIKRAAVSQSTTATSSQNIPDVPEPAIVELESAVETASQIPEPDVMMTTPTTDTIESLSSAMHPPTLPEITTQPATTVVEIIHQATSAPLASDATATGATFDATENFRQHYLRMLPDVVPRTNTEDIGKARPLVDYLLNAAGVASEGARELVANKYIKVNEYLKSMAPEGFAQEKISISIDLETYRKISDYFKTLKQDKQFEPSGEMVNLLGAALGMDRIKDLSVITWNYAAQEVDKTTTSFNKFLDSLDRLNSLLQARPSSISQIYDAIEIRENGGWYIGATVLALLAVGTAVDNEPGKRQIILTEAAMPGSSKHYLETQSAKATAVQNAMQIAGARAREIEENDATRKAMEEQVNNLKDATLEVLEQLEALKVEKNTRAYEVATMKSELRTVMNKLDLTLNQERNLRMSLEETQKQLKEETTSLRAQLQERAAAEEELRDQLAETKDRLAEEINKVEQAKDDAKLNLDSAKAEVLLLQKEKLEMEQKMQLMRNEVSELQKKLTAAKTLSDPEKFNGSDLPSPNDILENEINGSNNSVEKASQPKNNASYGDTSERFFGAISQSVKPSAGSVVVPGVREKTNAAIPTSPIVDQTAVPNKADKKVLKNGAELDWSQMSPSTLKRKTVKELTAYLEAKGATTTDAKGKYLKKDVLVQSILSV